MLKIVNILLTQSCLLETFFFSENLYLLKPLIFCEEFIIVTGNAFRARPKTSMYIIRPIKLIH